MSYRFRQSTLFQIEIDLCSVDYFNFVTPFALELIVFSILIFRYFHHVKSLRPFGVSMPLCCNSFSLQFFFLFLYFCLDFFLCLPFIFVDARAQAMFSFVWHRFFLFFFFLSKALDLRSLQLIELNRRTTGVRKRFEIASLKRMNRCDIKANTHRNKKRKMNFSRRREWKRRTERLKSLWSPLLLYVKVRRENEIAIQKASWKAGNNDYGAVHIYIDTLLRYLCFHKCVYVFHSVCRCICGFNVNTCQKKKKKERGKHKILKNIRFENPVRFVCKFITSINSSIE